MKKFMDNDVKVEKYYNPQRLRNAIFLMEQFKVMSFNIAYTPDDQKRAKLLSEHYRRLAVNIILKEFDPAFMCDQVLTKDFMDSIIQSDEKPEV